MNFVHHIVLIVYLDVLHGFEDVLAQGSWTTKLLDVLRSNSTTKAIAELVKEKIEKKGSKVTCSMFGFD